MCNCITVMETMQELLPKEIFPRMEESEKFTEIRQLYTLMYAHLREKSGLRAIGKYELNKKRKLPHLIGGVSRKQNKRKYRTHNNEENSRKK